MIARRLSALGITLCTPLVAPITRRSTLCAALAALSLSVYSAPASRVGATTTILSQTFDGMSTGNLHVGGGGNDFSGTSNDTNVQVVSPQYLSAPHALDTLADTTSNDSRAFKFYTTGYAAHALTFAAKVDSGYTFGPDGYTVLATVRTDSETNAAKVLIAMRAPGTDGDSSVYVQYTGPGPSFAQGYLWGDDGPANGLPGTGWHTFTLSEDIPAGSITFSIDGVTVASGTGLDLGGTRYKVNWFTIGNDAPVPGTSGHIWFDDVVTTTP